MFDKMKQLMEMKKQADRIKRELEIATVESNEGGIKIVINGSQNFKSIEIDAGLIQEDQKGNLEANLLQSVNAAIKKSQELAAQKMKAIMPSMPGL